MGTGSLVLLGIAVVALAVAWYSHRKGSKSATPTITPGTGPTKDVSDKHPNL